MTSRRFICLLFALLAVVVLVTDNGGIDGDGLVRWETQVLLHEAGELSPARYSIVMNLFAAPLYLLGQLLAAITGSTGEGRSELIMECVQRFNKFVVIGYLAWGFHFLRCRLRTTLPEAACAILVLLFGSLLQPHAMSFYSECLWGLLLLIAWTCFSGSPRLLLPGVAALALAIPLNPLLAFVAVGVVAALFLWRLLAANLPAALRDRTCWSIGIAVALGTALCLLENQLRRGAPTDFGYASEGFTGHLLHGIWAQMAAPARGILFFMPGFLLGPLLLARTLPPPQRNFVLLSQLIGWCIVIAYAKWRAWHGAWYWGPRFLLLLSVFSALYIPLWWRHVPRFRLPTIVCGMLGYAVYKCGIEIGQSHLLTCLRQDPGEGCYWQLRFSPYASWLSPTDLADMFTHHSLPVELIAIGTTVWLVHKYNKHVAFFSGER